MGAAGTAVLIATMATAAGDLEDGVTLYQNKDFRGALAAFGRAGAQPQSPRRRALIHAYIGILQYRFGLEDDARSSFEASLEHHGSIAFPDPSQRGAKRLYESLKPEPDPAPKAVKRKRRKRRRRRRAPRDPGEGPFPEEPKPPNAKTIAMGPPTALPSIPPPPPPSNLTQTVETTPGEEGSIVPWVVAGGAATAAVVGTVLVVVGRSNGNTAQNPMTNAAEAEDLYRTHRVQVGAGIAGLVVAGVAGTVAAVLFATE